MTPVLADELEEKQQQLTNIQQQIEAQQRKAEQARRKEQTIAGQLRAIQEELGKIIKQMKHCRQCRSDAIGKLGCDVQQEFQSRTREQS